MRDVKLVCIQREHLFVHAFVRRDRGWTLWGYTLAWWPRVLVMRGRRHIPYKPADEGDQAASGEIGAEHAPAGDYDARPEGS